MKLSDWARQQGISYRTAHRLFHSGKLPCRAQQLATGTILVFPEEHQEKIVVLYGRVSSHDQKDDLNRQMERLRNFAASRGLIVNMEKTEIGSGLNGKRKQLLSLLSDNRITTIVVEHKDRLTRFGFEYINAALSAVNRQIIVVNETEKKDDLVQDFIDVVTSMCARIYGQRSSKNRAERALKAASNEN